ncbi:polymorphic toxin-type HINT domain-containing protein [Luedemannella flava]
MTQTFGYDDMGRLTSHTGAGAEATTAARTFGYDLSGRMTSFAVPGASNTITYDDRDLPLTITGPSGNSSFGYNSDGSMTTRTDAAGTTNYTYDSAGRIATLKNTAAGVDIGYSYNDMSAISKLTYGTTGNTRTFTYDDMHRLTGDELKTSGGTSIAKIAYGWDANGNETSKTTTNFNGTTTANTYTYDLAGRLTTWNNGTTTTEYTYDKAGNRTRNGSRFFTYDARNRLTSDGVKTYAYTPRGSLATTTTGTVVTATAADAFDQVISQGHDTGTQTYSYDALNRAIRSGFSYTGLGNDLAGDGTATYVRDPSADVVGEVVGGSQRLAWTDLHDDIVGQFTATGTTLAGSTTYDPLGTVLASTTMIGNLGYQSEWTDAFTKRVNMLARWYNTDTGQFDSRDTASNSPIPASVDANRYQYGNANPLTVTDPSGHGFWSAIKSVGSAVVNTAAAVKNVVSTVANSNPVTSWIYNRAAQYTYSWTEKGMGLLSSGLNKMGFKGAAKSVDKGRKKVAAAANHHKKKADTAKKRVDQSVNTIKAAAKRAKDKTLKNIGDGLKKTGKWIKEHKKAIVEIAVGVVVMAGCTALTAGAGAIACAALAGAASSLAGQGVACAEGKEPGACSVGSFVKAGLVGGISGAVGGAVGGPLGGKLAQTFLSKGSSALTRGLFGAANGAITGGASGAASGAAASAVDYGMSCGKNCSWKGLGGAALSGARDGGIAGMVGGAGAGFKAARGKTCHSFDPATPVVMADGTTKPIKDVWVGDKVKATDPATGKTVAKPVTQLHLNHDRDLANVTVKDKKTGKETVLHTTWHHPFWNVDSKKWTDAADLKPGTHLRDDHGKATQIVTAIKVWTGLQWMRDLTVADIHTYYVLAGHTPVLVHNNNFACQSVDNQVPYDSTDLSSAALDHRIANQVPDDRNIGVFDYSVDDVRQPLKPIVSNGQNLHSEKQFKDIVEDLQNLGKKVTVHRVYSSKTSVTPVVEWSTRGGRMPTIAGALRRIKPSLGA